MSFSTTPASGSSTASTVVITPSERHDQTASSHSASSTDGRGKGKQRAESSVQWYTASESEGDEGMAYGGRKARVGWTRGVDESDESDYTPATHHRPRSLIKRQPGQPKVRRGSSSIASTPPSITFSEPHDFHDDTSMPYIPRSPRKRRRTSLRDPTEPIYDDDLPEASLPRRPGKRRIMAFVEIPYDEALARRIADGAYEEWSDILDLREEARTGPSQSEIASSLGEESRNEAGWEAARASSPHPIDASFLLEGNSEAARIYSPQSVGAPSLGEESREEAEVEAVIIVDEEGDEGDADVEAEEEDETMFSAEETLGDAAPAFEEDIWPPVDTSPERPQAMVVEPMVVEQMVVMPMVVVPMEVDEVVDQVGGSAGKQVREDVHHEARDEVRIEVREQVTRPAVEDTEDELSPLPEDRVYEEPEASDDSDYFEIVESDTQTFLPRPKKPTSKRRRTVKAAGASCAGMVQHRKVKAGVGLVEVAAELEDDEESLQDLVVAVPWLPPVRQKGSETVHGEKEAPSGSPIHERSCHQCHRMSNEPKMSCSNKPKNRRCPFFFCEQCCKHYSYFAFEPKSRSFVCPRCKDICECENCIRRREIFKSGSLNPFLSAPFNAIAGPSSAVYGGGVRKAGMAVLPMLVADHPGLPFRPMLGPRLSLSSSQEEPIEPEKSGWKGKGKGALRQQPRRQSEPKPSPAKRAYPPIMLRLRIPKSASTSAAPIPRIKEVDSDGDTVGDYSSDDDQGRRRGRSVAASSVTSRGNSRSPHPSASRPLAGGIQTSPTRARTLSTNEYLSSLAPMGHVPSPEGEEETEEVYSPFPFDPSASAEVSGLKVGSGTEVPTISVETPATPDGTVVPPISVEGLATPDEHPDWPSFIDSSSPLAAHRAPSPPRAEVVQTGPPREPAVLSLANPPNPPVALSSTTPLSSPPSATSGVSLQEHPGRRVRFDEAAPAFIPVSPKAPDITHLLPSLVVGMRTVSPPAAVPGNHADTPIDLSTLPSDQPMAVPSRVSVAKPAPRLTSPEPGKKAAASKSRPPKRDRVREPPPPPVFTGRVADTHPSGHMNTPQSTTVRSATPAAPPKPPVAVAPVPSTARVSEPGTRTWPLFRTPTPSLSSLSMAPPPFRPVPISALLSPSTITSRNSTSSSSQSTPSFGSGLTLAGDYPAWSTAPPPYSTFPTPASRPVNPYPPSFGSTPAPPKVRPTITPVPLAPLYSHFTPTLLGSTGINYQQHTFNQHYTQIQRQNHHHHHHHFLPSPTPYPPTPSSASTVEGKTAIGLEIALAQMRSRGWSSTTSGYFR